MTAVLVADHALRLVSERVCEIRCRHAVEYATLAGNRVVLCDGLGFRQHTQYSLPDTVRDTVKRALVALREGS